MGHGPCLAVHLVTTREHTEDPKTKGMTNAIPLSMIVFRHDPEEPVSAINCVTLPRDSV